MQHADGCGNLRPGGPTAKVHTRLLKGHRIAHRPSVEARPRRPCVYTSSTASRWAAARRLPPQAGRSAAQQKVLHTELMVGSLLKPKACSCSSLASAPCALHVVSRCAAECDLASIRRRAHLPSLDDLRRHFQFADDCVMTGRSTFEATLPRGAGSRGRPRLRLPCQAEHARHCLCWMATYLVACA